MRKHRPAHLAPSISQTTTWSGGPTKDPLLSISIDPGCPNADCAGEMKPIETEHDHTGCLIGTLKCDTCDRRIDFQIEVGLNG